MTNDSGKQYNYQRVSLLPLILAIENLEQDLRLKSFSIDTVEVVHGNSEVVTLLPSEAIALVLLHCARVHQLFALHSLIPGLLLCNLLLVVVENLVPVFLLALVLVHHCVEDLSTAVAGNEQ